MALFALFNIVDHAGAATAPGTSSGGSKSQFNLAIPPTPYSVFLLIVTHGHRRGDGELLTVY